MDETYDVMTYNGTFAEVAKHDSEANTIFQHVFYGMSRRAIDGTLRVEDIGSEPMPMTGMYRQSIEGTTAADAYHRDGMTIEEINAIDSDATNPRFMQNPFGLKTVEDIKQYVEYSDALQGKYEGLRDPWRHAEDMRTKTRKDFQLVLDMIERSPLTHKDPQTVIDLLELELEFSEILATDHGLREEVHQIIAEMYAKLAARPNSADS